MSHLDELRNVMTKSRAKEKPRDVWRTEFCPRDPPARVPEFHVKLKENAVPYICKSRKYNDEEYQYLKLHNQAIIDAELGFINHDSRWASRVLPVKKKDYTPTGGSQLSKPLSQSELLMAAYRQPSITWW